MGLYMRFQIDISVIKKILMGLLTHLVVSGNLFLFCSFSLSAQEPVVYTVVYDFSHVRDANYPEKPYRSEMMLSVGKSSSRFGSVTDYQSYKQFKDRAKQPVVVSAAPRKVVMGRPLLLTSKSEEAEYREQIMKDFTVKKLDKAALIGIKFFLVSAAPMPGIKWKIENEQKVLLGYNCQYAVGHWAGREYRVWFTTELPFQDGPWVLNGLPGLILEAVDSKNEVSFKATSLTENTDAEELVESVYPYDKCIEIKEKDYRKAVALFIKDPEAYTSAQVPGVKVEVMNRETEQKAELSKTKKYNPIELN